MHEDTYDIVIIGAGVAGLGAAVYARRFGMKTVILGEILGGTITKTHLVENYPGFPSLSGQELADHFIEHAKSVEAEIKLERVTAIEKNGDAFMIKSKNKEYHTKTVLFSTGTEHKKLQVESVTALENKGVSYCATCDGPFFKNKIIAVVGSGDSAAKEALLLSEYGSKVYIIIRGSEIHPEPINKVRVEKNPKIEMIPNANVIEAKGEKVLEQIVLDNGQTLDVQGLFIEIGRVPQTQLVKNLGVELNGKNEIKINRYGETNIPGFFAAGDCTDTDWKQAVTGVGEAAHCANRAYEYITKNQIE